MSEQKLLADGRDLDLELCNAIWAGAQRGIVELDYEMANRLHFRMCALETALESAIKIIGGAKYSKSDIKELRQILRGEP